MRLAVLFICSCVISAPVKVFPEVDLERAGDATEFVDDALDPTIPPEDRIMSNILEANPTDDGEELKESDDTTDGRLPPLTCCEAFTVTLGCKTGLVPPETKSFSTYKSLYYLAFVLVVIGLTFLPSSSINWNMLKSDSFSVCSEPELESKLEAIDKILKDLSHKEEAEEQLRRFGIAENWTSDMLKGAKFDGILLFPEKGACSEEDAKKAIEITRTAKCTLRVCVNPPAEGYCEDLVIPRPNKGNAGQVLQGARANALKRCPLSSLHIPLLDVQAAISGIDPPIPCPSWDDSNMNQIMNAISQTETIHRCIKPDPACVDVDTPCPPDAVMAKLNALSNYKEMISREIASKIESLDDTMRDKAKELLERIERDLKIVLQWYNIYFAGSLLFTKPFSPYRTKMFIHKIMDTLAHIPKYFFVPVALFALEVYDQIQIPEVKVYLDLLLSDPCAINPGLQAKRTEHITETCKYFEDMQKEFERLKFAIKDNCGDAAISTACMYDTWKSMGHDEILFPYPGATSNGSMFMEGDEGKVEMSFEQAEKYLSETFAGYCNFQEFWDATAGIKPIENGHSTISKALLNLLVLLAPLARTTMLLMVVQYGFAVFHPEGSVGGKYYVPGGVKDASMNEERMRQIIRLQNVVPLSASIAIFIALIVLGSQN